MLTINLFELLSLIMISQIYNDAVAILMIRTVTGILFFFQGYDKIFNIKIVNVVKTFSVPMGKIHIRQSLLSPLIYLSSIMELICGVLLFLGLLKTLSLYILAADMLFVAFAFSSVKAMWDMQYFFPRIVFILILLFSPETSDLFSFDYLMTAIVK